MHTGWICAHVIARGLPGRPRAIVGALQRESDMYDVDRLIELFKKNPGRPLKWPVVEGFDVKDKGKTYKEHRVGVAFIHGDSLEYQVEELAHAIRRAYAHGTQ
ncbi:uncharacterized protein PITG_20933 [Phytophthora infestans T30-4]|uniref:Uncharacterized protein n=1 Tax=Phytophthora infestans (strain T30-4) TaxID=403677 RepID=D0P3D3_PHYIT|nr:uncharacterized protein PITG_20933 [Phytophthora infestans T30-4]EEY59481.1 conserved hypothetical protein [Phytophthora infestans T30-4]|eukprot:XP_002895187.1 conserved hypothetical protein [Phytophthora infestans T30-4]